MSVSKAKVSTLLKVMKTAFWCHFFLSFSLDWRAHVEMLKPAVFFFLLLHRLHSGAVPKVSSDVVHASPLRPRCHGGDLRAQSPFCDTGASALGRVTFQGVIRSLTECEGLLASEEHGELPFRLCENFSDTEFDARDVNKEVEFTLSQVSARRPPRPDRISRAL